MSYLSNFLRMSASAAPSSAFSRKDCSRRVASWGVVMIMGGDGDGDGGAVGVVMVMGGAVGVVMVMGGAVGLVGVGWGVGGKIW